MSMPANGAAAEKRRIRMTSKKTIERRTGARRTDFDFHSLIPVCDCKPGARKVMAHGRGLPRDVEGFAFRVFARADALLCSSRFLWSSQFCLCSKLIA